MNHVEVFEFKLKNVENTDEIVINARRFAEALSKIPGIKQNQFLMDQEDDLKLWQIVEWTDVQAAKAGQRLVFALPEMSLFSYFLAMPPRRVGNWHSLARY